MCDRMDSSMTRAGLAGICFAIAGALWTSHALAQSGGYQLWGDGLSQCTSNNATILRLIQTGSCSIYVDSTQLVGSSELKYCLTRDFKTHTIRMISETGAGEITKTFVATDPVMRREVACP